MSEDRVTRLKAMEREELERIEGYERHVRRADGALDRDTEEQAIELENDEVVERLLQTSRERVEQIRHALARIDGDQGGTCESCGGPIAADRLEALPAATLCSDCASAQG